MKTSLFTSVTLAALLALSPVAMAETTTKAPAKPAATKTETKATAPKTEANADTKPDNKSWIGLTIEDKAGKQVGTVVGVSPTTGKIKEIQVKIGADVFKMTAKQVTKKGEKLVTSLTDAQLKKLPKVKG